MNYYNQHSQIKKEWDRQKEHLRIEISGLKDCDLKHEQKKPMKLIVTKLDKNMNKLNLQKTTSQRETGPFKEINLTIALF